MTNPNPEITNVEGHRSIYLAGNVYLPADFDEDDNLLVNNMPALDWVYKNYNLYDIQRYIARFAEGLSKEQAVDLFVQMKTEEAQWARLFRSEDLDPQVLVNALPAFKSWIESFTGKDIDSHSSPSTIKPSRLTGFFLQATSKSVTADPSSMAPLVGFIKSLDDMTKTVEGKGYGDRTSSNKFVRELIENLDFLPSKEYSVRAGIENVDGAVQLASALTDAGVVPESYWYREGVRHLQSPPNFAFLEALNARLIDNDDKLSGKYARSGTYFDDTYRLASQVLAGFMDDPNRNPQVAQAINSLIQRAIEIDGRPLPSQIISVANTITKLVNNSAVLGEHTDHLQPIDTREVQILPMAFAQLLYATRLGTAEDDKRQTEYQDSVYVNIMSWIIDKSGRQYDAWLEKRLEQDTAVLRIMYPNARPSELVEIAQRRGRVGQAVWKRWRRGYGLLT